MPAYLGALREEGQYLGLQWASLLPGDVDPDTKTVFLVLRHSSRVPA